MNIGGIGPPKTGLEEASGGRDRGEDKEGGRGPSGPAKLTLSNLEGSYRRLPRINNSGALGDSRELRPIGKPVREGSLVLEP